MEAIKTNTFSFQAERIVNNRSFEMFIQGLIIINLLSFSLETLPNLSDSDKSMLIWIEGITLSIFTMEYIMRIAASPNKRKFIFSFYGLVDLISILPLFLLGFTNNTIVRGLRLFRFFRILKMTRYTKAMIRFKKALLSAKEGIVIYITFSFLVLYFAAIGIFYFENPAQPDKFTSIFDSIWWAVCTLTTVGYGDIYPITVGGRVFTIAVLMVGLGVVAIPTGLLASALTKITEDKD